MKESRLSQWIRLAGIVALLALILPAVWTEGPKPARGAAAPTVDRRLAGRERKLSSPIPQATQADPDWVIEDVDARKRLMSMTHRALALDAAGYPHLAYGEDSLYYAHYDGTQWLIEEVDPAWGVGGYAALALDGAGRPHISYRDWYNADLKYARFDGSAWQIETVDSTGNVGEYASLALDANDHPHISYFDGSWNYDLKYAHFDGTAWQVETVDSAGDVGRFTSLALDASGRPHISYCLVGFMYCHDLKYAHFDGTSWLTETVDSTGGSYTSLALDTSGRPHISYRGGGGLAYAHLSGTVWISETVGSTVSYLTSLALDSADHPHISYYDYSNGEVIYTHHDGSAWQSDLVDSVGYMYTSQTFTSLALDGSGRPHVAYSNESGELKYSYHDGSAWQAQVVDVSTPTVDVGAYTSLALEGATDRPHISYYDWDNADLKYAHHDGSAWQIAVVDSAGDRGRYTSLVLDALGQPHITYYDSTNGDLRHAYYSDTVWITEAVDSAGNVGSYTSAASDSAGWVHVSYISYFYISVDNIINDYKYAYQDGSGWQIETVASSQGYYGAHTSLALDSADRPHMSYFDGPSDALRYAYNDGTGWVSETVAIIGFAGTGGYNSLALDSADRPHIAYAYYDPADYYELWYAYHDGSTWQFEVVDSTGDAGLYVSLDLDSADRPHVSYHAGSPDDLRYAYHDGTAWQIEAVDTDGSVGQHTSLALDSAERPHVSYYGNYGLKYAWRQGCITVTGALITGPTSLGVGETAIYTATYTPPSATLPVTLTWDNGTVGPNAAYSWTLPGAYTIVVTAANGCGLVSATLPVTVSCYPLQGVGVAGPTVLSLGETGLYTATYTPPSATLPVTLTWDNGTVGPTAAYSWTLPGTHTVRVTATNSCGVEVWDDLIVEVVTSCTPLEGVVIAGPASLGVGETGLYMATYTPPTATLPVTLTWDNGTVGPTAAYSWTLPGTHTIVVTAANGCGLVSATLPVAVFCYSVQEVGVAGPTVLSLGETGLYMATYTPPSATLPVTLTWDNGTVGPTAAYSWTLPGTYSITVTAANPCTVGVIDSFAVEVLYRIYLPLVLKSMAR